MPRSCRPRWTAFSASTPTRPKRSTAGVADLAPGLRLLRDHFNKQAAQRRRACRAWPCRYCSLSAVSSANPIPSRPSPGASPRSPRRPKLPAARIRKCCPRLGSPVCRYHQPPAPTGDGARQSALPGPARRGRRNPRDPAGRACARRCCGGSWAAASGTWCSRAGPWPMRPANGCVEAAVMAPAWERAHEHSSDIHQEHSAVSPSLWENPALAGFL